MLEMLAKSYCLALEMIESRIFERSNDANLIQNEPIAQAEISASFTCK